MRYPARRISVAPPPLVRNRQTTLGAPISTQGRARGWRFRWWFWNQYTGVFGSRLIPQWVAVSHMATDSRVPVMAGRRYVSVLGVYYR